jgi:hypothetical protein
MEALAIETESRALVQPDISEGNDLLAFANAYQVVDQESANLFADWRNVVKTRKNAVIRKLEKIKQDAYNAWKGVVALETEATKPLEDAGRVADRKLIDYRIVQERLAAQARAVQEAEARRVEEEHRLAVAEAQEAAGEHEAAAATISEPIAIVVAPAPRPVVEGLTFRETFKAEVTDKAAFLKAVGANPALLHLADPNMVALNQLARAQKEMLSIPGVRVVKEKQVATGRK